MTVRDTTLADVARRLGVPDWLLSVGIGVAFAILAVALRYFSPIPNDVLAVGFVYPAMMCAAIVAGTASAFTTFVVGGVASWYYVLHPRHSFNVSHDANYTLVGFFVIGLTVLLTAELYRRGERKLHQTEMKFAQREAEHHQLLTREMNHRVKNMLGLVQAVAYQTFGKLDAASVHEFNGRLKAIGDAQSVLTQDKKPRADLREIIGAAVHPFHSGNVTVVGESCMVDDQQAVWLGLTLHELATNATKYGALSLPYGRVTVDTELTGDGQLRLVWQEHNGPKVIQPMQLGFGSKLLSQAKAKVEYLPSGVRCEIRNIRCVA